MYTQATQCNERFRAIAVAESEDTTAIMKSIHKELDSVKFKSFGKVKLGKSAKVSDEVKNLNKEKTSALKLDNKDKLIEINEKLTEHFLKEQRENLETGIKSLKEVWKNKGKSASIFKLKESVVGPKKPQQEPTYVKDPKTKKEVFDVKIIKQKSVDYCVDLLTNRAPLDEYKDNIESKNLIHEYRMSVRNPEDEIEYSDNLFWNALERLKKNKNQKYDFVLKAGEELKQALNKLFKLVWTQEKKPEQWRLTNIIQIFKGRGPQHPHQRSDSENVW